MKRRSKRQAGLFGHEVANRLRGTRARDQLAHKRQRERKRLSGRAGQRTRNYTRASPAVRRFRQTLVFVVSIALGALLAGPVEEIATQWLSEESSISRIAIQGNVRLSFQDVALATGVARGQAMSEINPQVVEGRLRAQPWVRDAHVLRLPSGTLLVSVNEREPRARLSNKGDSELLESVQLLDVSGHVFEVEGVDIALPHLITPGSTEREQEIWVLRQAVSILDRLRIAPLDRLSREPTEVTLHMPEEGAAEGWVIHSDGLEVLLGRHQVGARIDRLVELMSHDKSRPFLEQEHLRIDLRFSGQAVLSDPFHTAAMAKSRS